MRIDGQRVRASRDAKGISRERLAAKIGVSTKTIERVETDQGDVAAGTAYLIAQELEVDLRTLFTEEPAEESVA
jgi:transcriptional regulator with XRE-family HTH domain